MDCGRKMIYFSTYENGEKTRRAGYAGIFLRGNTCDVQLYYRSDGMELGLPEEELHPVYVFRDGTVVEGEALPLAEGMAAAEFRTGRQDFLQSGRSLEELEVIYIDGVSPGICGGRVDGQELTEEAAYTLTDWMDTVSEVIPVCGVQKELSETELSETEQEWQVGDSREEKVQEHWTLSQCLERFPEMKLPFDGMRRKCCRMSLEDMEHLPEEWVWLKDNHFLLHGYYEYHHLLLARLSSRYGEGYAIGVPGEFCYRNQYMAENFGFYDFAPLEQGKRRGGSFGYWYFYLEKRMK